MIRNTYQTPGGVAAVQVDNGTKVVVQRNVDEETASNPIFFCIKIAIRLEGRNPSLQSTSLEEVFVIFGPGLLGLVFRQLGRRLCETTVLVDGGKLLNNVIVETARNIVNYNYSDPELWGGTNRFSMTSNTQQAGGKA